VTLHAGEPLSSLLLYSPPNTCLALSVHRTLSLQDLAAE
jgi:hypothetical protein